MSKQFTKSKCVFLYENNFKTISCIQETLNLSMCADISTNTIITQICGFNPYWGDHVSFIHHFLVSLLDVPFVHHICSSLLYITCGHHFCTSFLDISFGHHFRRHSDIVTSEGHFCTQLLEVPFTPFGQLCKLILYLCLSL